jgi:Na+/proline symporter
MSVEYTVAIAYLVLCIGVGFAASRRVLASRDEYWVAGRRIGTLANSLAIMAALASGGSIIGVMGLTYAQGIPATLALFTGAIVGFPLASILVAEPLRRFGRFTITDFLRYRYPHAIVAWVVPLLIVVSFTIYIVAQMKAAGITAAVLLGLEYEVALTLATLVFVLYVSIGGMLAVTWTDIIQGALMLLVVAGAAATLIWQFGTPGAILSSAVAQAPEIATLREQPLGSYLGSFVIWATAIPIIPHIVMRVFTAKDARSARVSLNVSMLLYAALILAAVFAVAPVGKMQFPNLADPDLVFLRVMEEQFPPLFRGLAVAAVLAAVMSTTDALLLACSSAIAHDLMGQTLKWPFTARGAQVVVIGTAWVVGLIAMLLAYSPPALISEFYTAAIGLLTSGLFVPTIAGLWWRRANLAGGIAALLIGPATYLAVHFTPGTPPLAAILYALPASAAGMALGGLLGSSEQQTLLQAIEGLHRGQPPSTHTATAVPSSAPAATSEG